MINPIIRVILVAVTLPVLFTACTRKPKAAPPAPPLVLVATVVQENVPIYGEVIATLDGSTNTSIRAQVSGYVTKQAYSEGSQVKVGDLLFEIDQRPFLAALEKAKADLASAQARQIQTQQDVNRNRKLIESNAVSKMDLDTSIQANAASKAAVDSSQALVDQAQLNLTYTKVIAPISGVAGKAALNVGDLVGPSQELTTISTLDPIRAIFSIPEQMYLERASEFMAAMARPFEDRKATIELLLSNGSTYPEKGKFSYIDRQVDSSTGSISIYALFPNPKNILRPGQNAKIRAVTKSIDGALMIPQKAVMEIQGMYQVFVLKPDNTVEMRMVNMGDRVGSHWIVQSGLNAGEKIVVEGLMKCRPGSPVTPQPYKDEMVSKAKGTTPSS